MKHVLNTLGNRLVYMLFIFTSYTGWSQQNNLQCKDISEHEREAHVKRLTPPAVMAQNNYNIIYHRCYWEINPAVNYIKGAITTIFQPAVSGFNQLEFDLDSTLTVDSVTYHATKVAFVRQAPALVKITLPAVINEGVSDSVVVFYQGKPTGSGFGSFIQSNHNNVPIIWTLSEPYGAKDWWPCKQNLSDKIDSIDILVKVPAGNRVGSNGVLVSETAVDSSKLFHWKSRYPIATYLVAIAVTNYASYSDFVPMANDTLEVLNYVFPESLASAQNQTKGIVKIIQLYDSLTIDYPFAKEKYGHAQFGWGGGMEHQTMSFMVNFNFGLMAHECAHQWFGDYITCRSWEDIWLNEGFATYFQGLTVQRYFPNDWMNWKKGALTSITSQPGGSVRCDDTTNVGRIFSTRLTYNKGAYLLHMLRWKLGNVNFFNALKNYLNDPKLKGNFAGTTALKKHLETVSGQNLDIFFNQWYYNQGYPSYQVNWTQNGGTVSFTIGQTQSHPSVAFFEMPVPLKFIGSTGDTTIVFNHTSSGQSFTATVNFPVQTILVDPELWLISANNTVVSINEKTNTALNFKLYPNPSQHELYIENPEPANAIRKLSLTNGLGQVLVHVEPTEKQGNRLQFPIAGFDSGMYYLKIESDKGIQVLRFVKE